MAVGGVWQPTKKQFVAVGGVWQPAKKSIVANGGYWRLSWLSGAAINSFTASPSPTLPSTRINVSWNVTGAASVRFLLGTEIIYTSSLASGTATLSGTYTPGATYTIGIQVLDIAAKAWTKVLATAKVVMSQPSAPTNLRVTTYDFDSAVLAWNAVGGASAYKLYRRNPGSTSYSVLDYTGTATAKSVPGLKSQQTYSWRVYSVISGKTSAASAATSVKTAAKPYTPGAKIVSANFGATWHGVWRVSSDGLFHGNGSAYGSSKGTCTSFLYYDPDNPTYAGLRAAYAAGATVTRFEAFLHRRSGVGGSGAVRVRWWRHTNVNKPSGSPMGSLTGSSHDAGDFSWGEYMWVTLPTSWGEAMLSGAWNMHGIAIGYVSSRYALFEPVSGTLGGDLRITIQ